MVVKIYPYNHRITISNLSTAGQVTDPAPPKSALPGGTGPADRFRKLQGRMLWVQNDILMAGE